MYQDLLNKLIHDYNPQSDDSMIYPYKQDMPVIILGCGKNTEIYSIVTTTKYSYQNQNTTSSFFNLLGDNTLQLELSNINMVELLINKELRQNTTGYIYCLSCDRSITGETYKYLCDDCVIDYHNAITGSINIPFLFRYKMIVYGRRQINNSYYAITNKGLDLYYEYHRCHEKIRITYLHNLMNYDISSIIYNINADNTFYYGMSISHIDKCRICDQLIANIDLDTVKICDGCIYILKERHWKECSLATITILYHFDLLFVDIRKYMVKLLI